MGAGVVEKVESWREADGVRVDKIMTRPDYSRSGLFFQPGQPVMLDASPRQPVRQACHSAGLCKRSTTMCLWRMLSCSAMRLQVADGSTSSVV